MNREAAALGVPSIASFAADGAVDRYLARTAASCFLSVLKISIPNCSEAERAGSV